MVCAVEEHFAQRHAGGTKDAADGRVHSSLQQPPQPPQPPQGLATTETQELGARGHGLQRLGAVGACEAGGGGDQLHGGEGCDISFLREG